MTRRFRSAWLATATLLLAACAALPDDAPVVEQLDDATGATVTRFGHAFELFRENMVQKEGTRFAFIGPFETNQMGTRETFLWLAVPVESPRDALPVVEVDGAALELGAPSRSPDLAGLRASPYRIPTPWSTMYYYKIDAALRAQLGNARKIVVRVVEETKEGPVKNLFSAEIGADTRFSEFARGQ